MRLKIILLSLALTAAFLFTLNSCGEDCKFVEITTDTLPDAFLGEEYYAKIEYDMTCSYVSKSVKIVDGNLPKGIEMDGAGVFGGVPQELGTDSFTVKTRLCFGTSATEYTDCSEKEKKFAITVREK